jgi:hypothetical protein
MKTFAAAILTLGLLSGAASAQGVFADIQNTAPKSIFDQLNETAPRTIFDDLRDVAPRTVFDDLRDSAPRSDGVFGDLERNAP